MPQSLVCRGNKTLQIVTDICITSSTRRIGRCSARGPAEPAVKRFPKAHRMVLDCIRAGDARKAGELWQRQSLRTDRTESG